MKLSEILEQVDVLVPNSINTNTKVSWINHVQNQLYRDYPLSQAVNLFNLKKGQSLYVLPSDCPEDRIEEVVINDDHYPFVTGGEADGRFCAIVAGTLLVHPTPTELGIAFLFYKQRPTQLSASKMDEETNFPVDFQELLVLGCASRVAKSSPGTVNLAAVFDQDYFRLAEKADIVLKRKRQNKMNIVQHWM